VVRISPQKKPRIATQQGAKKIRIRIRRRLSDAVNITEAMLVLPLAASAGI
jgi:hypothetical protein